MRKNKLVVILLTLFSLSSLFLSPSIFQKAVQGQDVAKESTNWVCLKGNRGPDRVPQAEEDVKVVGDGFPNDKDVYIVFCASSANKTRCTTSNAANDVEILGADNTANTNPKVTIQNSKQKPQNGHVETTAHFTGAKGHVAYPFFGVYKSETINTNGDQGAAQKQGTFTFEKAVGKCRTIYWDPFGRIFDSQSLEPMSNVGIKTLDSISPEKLTSIPNNPMKTIEDGVFNFLVKPGTYFLRLFNIPATHTFTAAPKLDPNYKLAYIKDDGTNTIYKPDDPIVEQAGAPEQRDVPLDPGTNTPYHAPVINMPGTFDQMVFGSVTKYGGKISHPLSQVALIGEVSKKEYTRVTADKWGFWEILVNNEAIPQDEALLPKPIKVDLTTGKTVDDPTWVPAANDPKFQPVARYVDGYAYDKNGDPIPGARVEVVQNNNSKVTYQATADANGHFSIASGNLPIFSYDLNVKSATTGAATKLTVSAFAQQNKDYLDKNNISLMSGNGKKSTSPISFESSGVGSNNTANNGGGTNGTGGKNGAAVQSQNSNTLLVLVMTLFVLFVIVGVVLFFSFRKKQTGEEMPPTTTPTAV